MSAFGGKADIAIYECTPIANRQRIMMLSVVEWAVLAGASTAELHNGALVCTQIEAAAHRLVRTICSG